MTNELHISYYHFHIFEKDHDFSDRKCHKHHIKLRYPCVRWYGIFADFVPVTLGPITD